MKPASIYQISVQTILWLSLALAIFHGLATYYNLYFFIWWFDIPMHILGGVLVVAVVLAFYEGLCSKAIFQNQKSTAWWVMFAGVLFVGVAWEYFEYMKGITFNTIGSYRIDVLKDISMDMLGGIFSGVCFLRKK